MMRHLFTSLILLILGIGTVQAQTGDLIRSTPEAEGISSEYVVQFLDSVLSQPKTQVHSCIILRHGRVIAEVYPKPWKAEYPQTMYSASKTFTAAAIGLCIEDSLISLNDSVYTYLQEAYPENASDTLKSITIRNLLTMESGIPVDTKMRTVEKNWLQFYFTKKARAIPGTMYAYDSIVTYMLSAIVQKVTGMKLFDFLKMRLFNPLHITNVAWEESPRGINCGGWGLYIQPESMAKFGQLLLREGRWNGYEVLPAWWVKEMMKPQSTTGKYGYQMWIGLEKGWAEANGAYGQYILVMPKQDMVIAMTCCNSGSMPYQRFAKEILAKHVKDKAVAVSNKPNKLVELQKVASLAMVKGKPSSKKHALPVTLELSGNDLGWQKLVIKPGQKEMKLVVTDTERRTYALTCIYNMWRESTFKGEPYTPRHFQNNFSNLPKTWHVASSYAWVDNETLKLRLNWIDWLTSAEITIKFTGATATFFVKGLHSGKTVAYKAWIK